MTVADRRADGPRAVRWRRDGHVAAGRETGAGTRPVLVLHASGAGARAMDGLAGALAGRGLGPVLALDLPGYGDSRLADPARLDWPALHGFLNAALDAWGRGPADLIGHSMGGLLALRLALAESGRARRLVLIEPMVFGVLDAASDAEAAAVGRLPLDWFGAAAAAGADPAPGALEAFVDLWGAGGWGTLSDATKARLRALGPQIAREAVMVSRDDLAPETARALSVPALLIGGGRSPPAAGAILARLNGCLPGSRRATYPDLGHMLAATHGPALAPRIAAFLMGAAQEGMAP